MKTILQTFNARTTDVMSFALLNGDLISLEDAAGWGIICRRGTLWLSTQGRHGQQGQDIELYRNEHQVIECDTKVLIETAGTATFDLIAPPPTSVFERRGKVRVSHAVNPKSRHPSIAELFSPPA